MFVVNASFCEIFGVFTLAKIAVVHTTNFIIIAILQYYTSISPKKEII